MEDDHDPFITTMVNGRPVTAICQCGAKWNQDQTTITFTDWALGHRLATLEATK
jgi:hypothetical protein